MFYCSAIPQRLAYKEPLELVSGDWETPLGLVETIESIKDRISKNSYRNEAEVREAIVNRILRELDWDIYDPSAVSREYNLQNRRVDYALFTPRSVAPAVILEVKPPKSDEGERQLFEYAFYEGTQLAVLVNGREWSFYLPGQQGNYFERRVQKLDLSEREANESASILERYLRFDRVRNGSALSDAQSDYQSATRQREAGKTIPRAWEELLAQRDEKLLDVIAEKVISLIGFRPTDEQIEAFLRAPVSSSNFSTPSTFATPSTRYSQEETPTEVSTRAISFKLLGQVHTNPDAITALIFILQTIAKRDPNFLTNFAKKAPGRTRNHIAKVRSQVYPGKPDLEVYTTEIEPGWWLGTNIANRDKERLARIACEVAGLNFGKDLIIKFPNVDS